MLNYQRVANKNYPLVSFSCGNATSVPTLCFTETYIVLPGPFANDVGAIYIISDPEAAISLDRAVNRLFASSWWTLFARPSAKI